MDEVKEKAREKVRIKGKFYAITLLVVSNDQQCRIYIK